MWHRTLIAMTALLVLVGSLDAAQLDRRRLISPITNQPFDVDIIPVMSGAGRNLVPRAPLIWALTAMGVVMIVARVRRDYYVALVPIHISQH